MKTPMEMVQDACLEVSAKGYHEPYEEMKLADFHSFQATENGDGQELFGGSHPATCSVAKLGTLQT